MTNTSRIFFTRLGLYVKVVIKKNNALKEQNSIFILLKNPQKNINQCHCNHGLLAPMSYLIENTAPFTCKNYRQYYIKKLSFYSEVFLKSI